MGPNSQKIINAALERGHPIPPGAIPPELFEVSEPYWKAFSRLSGDRPFGSMGGAGRIPFTAIAEYADRFYPNDTEFLEELIEFIDQMDKILLDHLARKAEADRKQREAEAKAKRQRG